MSKATCVRRIQTHNETAERRQAPLYRDVLILFMLFATGTSWAYLRPKAHNCRRRCQEVLLAVLQCDCLSHLFLGNVCFLQILPLHVNTHTQLLPYHLLPSQLPSLTLKLTGCNLNQLHFKGSVATFGSWLPHWTVQIQNIFSFAHSAKQDFVLGLEIYRME